MTNTLAGSPLPRSERSARRERRSSTPVRAGERFASSVFFLPVIAIFIVLYAIPLLRTIYYSFTDYDGLTLDVSFVGWRNYAAVFDDASLVAALGFTVLYAFATTVVITVLAVPLAVVLNKRFFGRAFARSLFFFVGVPSMVILGLVWQFIFSPLGNGALNSILRALGLSSVPWLADSMLARICVIFVAVWAQVGWHATLYLAFLQSIPHDIYEQSDIDGASSRQQFWNITVPELIPAMLISTFLLVTNGLKVFDLPYAMTRGGPGYATNTVTQAIIVRGLSEANYGLGSALATLFTVACVAVVLIQLKVTTSLARRYS